MQWLWLRRHPFLIAYLPANLQMNVGALLVPRDNVRQSITVEVGGRHLGANAGVVMDEVRDKIDSPGCSVYPVFALEPVGNRCGVGLGVAV